MRRKIVLGALVLVGTVALVAAAAALIIGTNNGQAPAPAVRVDAPRSGDELVAVLLLTRSCPAAQTEEFRSSLRSALGMVRQAARARGLRSHVVGVMIAANTGANRRLIAELAPFDEIVVGRGWLSTGAISYIWRDLPGPATVPQLVLLQRRVSIEGEHILVSPDSILLRLADANEIVRWSRAGAPIEL